MEDNKTSDDGPLRAVLTTNAITSGTGGAAAVVAAGPVDGLLGTGEQMWVRVVGAGLVAFAAFVIFVARSARSRLRHETPMISAGDAAWVVGTIVTIALGWYSTTGAIAMAVVAAMVAVFAVLQLRLLPEAAGELSVAA